jgi:hypothetical protein
MEVRCTREPKIHLDWMDLDTMQIIYGLYMDQLCALAKTTSELINSETVASRTFAEVDKDLQTSKSSRAKF